MIKVLTFYVIFIQCKEEEKIAANLFVYFPTIFFFACCQLNTDYFANGFCINIIISGSCYDFLL